LREKSVQEKIEPDTLAYKGELFRTYLIYETGDNVYLIDQHAAHERLIYNRLKKSVEERAVVSQPMLAPYVITLNAQEFAFLIKQLPVLQEMGFDAEDFGGTSIRISAVPAELKDISLGKFFGEILGSMETLRAVKLTDILKDKLASAACKAAVKGGECLTEREARALIEEAEGDMGLRCPHGRPAAVKIKRAELEKLFKRIV
jgi:DNA mismatch repair protein MutL